MKVGLRFCTEGHLVRLSVGRQGVIHHPVPGLTEATQISRWGSEHLSRRLLHGFSLNLLLDPQKSQLWPPVGEES